MLTNNLISTELHDSFDNKNLIEANGQDYHVKFKDWKVQKVSKCSK